MQSWLRQGAWKSLACTALAVVAFASPAAAQVTSSTSVVAVPSTASTGQPVTLDATVTCDGDPSGGLGMTFFDGANLLATVPVAADGAATYTTSFSTAGTHTITAAYNGNGNCDASNGTTTVEVTSAPPPPPGLCLLTCGGIVTINIDNSDKVYKVYKVYNIYKSYNNDIDSTYNVFNDVGAYAPR